MSANAPTQTEAQQALQFMAEQVYGPAIFEKLAANGIRPRDVTEARQLLQLASTLEQAEAAGIYKSAATSEPSENQFLNHVNSRLQSALAPYANGCDTVQDGALTLVRNDPLSKTAALLYAHVLKGGEVTEDATQTS